MKTALLCVSYRGDFDWLPYLLLSVRKFCSGFSEFVLSVPKSDESLVRRMDLTGVRVETRQPSMHGYMDQQFEKCNADVLCPDADFVVHVDSDCVFKFPVTPDVFFEGGKPRLLLTPYSVLGNAVPWKPYTEEALGFEVEFEGMRRQGLTYRNDTYGLLRDRIHKVHGKSIRSYLDKKTTEFSEFNCLSLMAWTFQKDKYHWIDTTKETFPPEIIRQFWSGVRANSPDVQSELGSLLSIGGLDTVGATWFTA